jgi:hypothetical protein
MIGYGAVQPNPNTTMWPSDATTGPSLSTSLSLILFTACTMTSIQCNCNIGDELGFVDNWTYMHIVIS